MTCTNLHRLLTLSGNRLVNGLPNAMPTLFPGLQFLDVRGNLLGGTIPSSLTQLPTLVYEPCDSAAAVLV